MKREKIFRTVRAAALAAALLLTLGSIASAARSAHRCTIDPRSLLLPRREFPFRYNQLSILSAGKRPVRRRSVPRLYNQGGPERG
jgi:hypothetical protein